MAMNVSHTASGIVNSTSNPLPSAPPPNRMRMPLGKASGPSTKSFTIAIGRGTRPD